MREIKLKVKKALVIEVPHGPDQVKLTLSGPSTFPEDGYEPEIDICVAKGFGRAWLAKVFGIDLSSVQDKLAANPDMSVYERNMEEEPCGHCGTPLLLSETHPKNRQGQIFCDNRCRRLGKISHSPSTYPPCRVEDRN